MCAIHWFTEYEQIVMELDFKYGSLRILETCLRYFSVY